MRSATTIVLLAALITTRSSAQDTAASCPSRIVR